MSERFANNRSQQRQDLDVANSIDMACDKQVLRVQYGDLSFETKTFTLPGMLTRPAKIPGIDHWQIETAIPSGGADVIKVSDD